MDDLSKKILNSLSKKEKQEQGIFFTPSKIASELYKKVPITPKSILEPSCGSGEFLKILPTTMTTGIELNKNIYETIKPTYKNILNMSFLDYNVSNKHDLIIGNPPYFTTTIKYDSEFLYGRNNMYVLFLIHAMKLLKENGVIAFIIPTNFMNSSYYNKLRKEIFINWTISEFVQYDDIFEETKQSVFGLIIQKTKSNRNKKFVFVQDDSYYFVFSKKHLPKTKYTTLNDMGYEVKVGKIQWDANKHLLKPFKSQNDTILIYSNDITNKGVVLQNKKSKYRCLKDVDSLKGPVIILNRGYGNAKYKLKATLFDPSYKFQLENHVLYIKHKEDRPNINLMKHIEKSLHSDNTTKFIDTIFMNNGINSFELQHIFPIYR